MPKELVVVKDTYTELASKKEAMRLLAMQKELTPADYNTLQAYIEDVKALQTSHEELTQEAYARLLAIICETPDYLSISTLNVTPIHDITVKWGNKNIEIKKIDSATREEITGLSIDYAGREIIGIPLDS